MPQQSFAAQTLALAGKTGAGEGGAETAAPLIPRACLCVRFTSIKDTRQTMRHIFANLPVLYHPHSSFASLANKQRLDSFKLLGQLDTTY